MSFLPLNIPPGVFKPGTKYDARGRWFDSTLVRWHENAMQAVGGWERVDRTVPIAVAAAISDDGGVFTDETTDANDVGADDVVLIPATPQVDDAFYIGSLFRFEETQVTTSTAATDGAVTWEYYNGTAWVALTLIVDETVGFTSGAAAAESASWDLPSDWAVTTINSQGPFYYVRARVTTAGTTTALGTQVWIGRGPADIQGPGRGMHSWRANDKSAQLAIGTATKLWHFAGGVLTDLTPAGFTAGGVDATLGVGGYGSGAYGIGPYGVGDTSQTTLVEANSWQIDNFGEDLVAVAFSDGVIYSWDKSVGLGTLPAALANAPTDNVGVVVTPERFVVAIGAGGDRRLVQWSDQENPTDWTPTDTSQAGNFPIVGRGQLMAGRRARSETLIWTDTDLYAMRFIGGTLVYSFLNVGEQCGAISRRSMVMLDGLAVWMGPRAFYVYDGNEQPLESDVGDFVFNDMNPTQVSKIYAETVSDFGEVRWYYCSAGSTEIDRYVSVNMRKGHWAVGALERTSGVDQGVFNNPVSSDAAGILYFHEKGEVYLDPAGNALTPFAETGPLELGSGDQIMLVRRYLPDEQSLGDMQATIFSSFNPTDTEVTNGPFTATAPTDMRFSARQIRLRVTQVSPGWRHGTPRLDVVPQGLR